MNIILEPHVELIAASCFFGHSKYRVPQDGGDATRLCSFAAKGCYDSFGREGRPNADNQKQIIESRHGSVLEHYNVTLFIEGITRACSHEIVRHRAGFAYSQRSTRYTEEKDAAIVLEPYYADLYRRLSQGGRHPFRVESALISTHVAAAEEAVNQYKHEVAALLTENPLGLSGTPLRKWARGKARNILPHSLETRMTMTGNLRAWRHFIGMRSAKDAEAEIRRLAAAIFPILAEDAPDHFADFTKVEHPDGIPEYIPGTWKV